MAAPPTFGLSATAIGQRHFGYVLTDNTRPTITAAEGFFTEAAARVAAFFRGREVAVEELTADGDLSDGYYLARDLLHDRYMERLVLAATSNESQLDTAKYYQKRVQNTEQQLRTWIQDLGNARPQGNAAPGRMGPTFERRTRRSDFRQAQGDRLGRLIDKNRPKRPR